MKVEIDSYHVENFRYMFFALRDDRITKNHIDNIIDELSSVYYKVTGVDLWLEDNDLE